jgi:uncharacterized protein
MFLKNLHHPAGHHSPRIAGFDRARGVALCIMLLLNVKGIFCHDMAGSGWLINWVEFLDRRAAVILVMVSGAGVSLFLGRKAGNKGWKITGENESVLVKRSIFLLSAGYLLTSVWSGDILHFYAIFFFSGIFFSRFSGRQLLLSGLCIWLISVVRQTHSFSIYLEEIPQGGYISLLQDVLFTGYFPFFPWACFFIAGMQIGRFKLHERKSYNFMMVLGLMLAAVSELMAFAVSKAVEHLYAFPGYAVSVLQFAQAWTVMDLTIPTPLSVVSGLGTGMCAIGVCFIVSDRWRTGGNDFLTVMGRTSLTLYLLHIICISLVVWGLRIKQINNGALALSIIIVFAAVYYLTMGRWLQRFQKGPFELLLRHFSDSRQQRTSTLSAHRDPPAAEKIWIVTESATPQK